MLQKEYWKRSEHTLRRHPGHPVIRAYVLHKIREIAKHIEITNKTRLLDVGCGNGHFTFYFSHLCKTYGVDYSETLVRMNPVKETLVMDANQLGFKDNTFDIVFCAALLHHVENNIDRVIHELIRVSKKYVVIIEPNRNNPAIFLFHLLAKEERRALGFSLHYLRRIIADRGLRLVDSFSCGSIAPNKAPVFILPLLKCFNLRFPLGMTNVVIAHKKV